MQLRKIYIVATLILMTNLIFGQKKKVAQPELESGSIESQFDYIINKSTSFKDFQLIRKASINKVKQNTIDSLRAAQTDVTALKTAAQKQQETVIALQAEINVLKEENATISENVESIAVLGKNVNKSAYQTITWLVLGVLLVFLVVLVLRFKSSNSNTKQTKHDLDKIGNELEEVRKKALKKEQELMRKLQDELNKNSH